MERIDRRAPIKVIAQDLGVSETRINQHIRALKDIYQAENLADLVECYRAENAALESQANSKKTKEKESLEEKGKAFSEAVYSKSQVPDRGLIVDQKVGIDPGELVMSDVFPMVDQAPWLGSGEPRIVPRVLDGEHAVWFRLVAIVGIAFGFLAAVVLTVTAAVTISEALDGRATVPVDNEGFS
ncbi:MAG: hypothetical protein AAGA97_12585 [Pseudomonadota bacterium]